jgi:hypothetical protein
VSRGFARTMGVLVALAPAFLLAVSARAQTNIDEGKTPAQMFASDCGVCHKAVRGLANGRNNPALTSFLDEHYTSNRKQAAALAAYVLAAPKGDPTADARPPKPGSERGRARIEDPKPGSHQARRPAKPEEERPATARLQGPGEPEEAGHPARPPAKRRELGTRVREPEPAAPTPAAPGPIIAAPEPASAAPAPVPAPAPQPASAAPVPTVNPEPIAPAPAEIAGSEPPPSRSAAAPPEPQPVAGSSVPRDNIPD